MSSMRKVAVVQARMSSSRFPGKVIEPLAGKTMIAFLLARLARSSDLSEIVVATSQELSDDPLECAVRDAGFACIRGPLDDVLMRYKLAAAATSADIIVRITGDCPLIDPQLVDAILRPLVLGEADYVSNTNPPTYPDGLDCEAFTRAALERAVAEAAAPLEREHVTPFIRQSGLFRMINVASAVDLSALRWTVDYPDDLDYVRTLVDLVSDDPVDCDRFDFLRAMDRMTDCDHFRHLRNEALVAQVANAITGTQQ